MLLTEIELVSSLVLKIKEAGGELTQSQKGLILDCLKKAYWGYTPDHIASVAPDIARLKDILLPNVDFGFYGTMDVVPDWNGFDS